MEISNTSIGALAAFCVVAGAGGAYLATRVSEPHPAEVATEVPSQRQEPSSPPVVERPEATVRNDTAQVFNHTPVPPRATARPTARPRPVVSRERQPQVVGVGPESGSDLGSQPQPVSTLETRIAIPPASEPVRLARPEPILPEEPALPEFEELIVVADSVVGLQVETSITSDHARIEDEVVARVTRDVRVGDRVAIPAWAKAHGEVTLVERGGRLRDRARLAVRFTSVVFADGTRVPLETDTIYREGDARSRESASRIGGGAIGGAIIGGLFGGTKGAVIGGSAGAGAGTAAVLARGRNAASLPSGTPITVRLIEPTTVTVEK